jgi:ankyrin repeat protein
MKIIKLFVIVALGYMPSLLCAAAKPTAGTTTPTARRPLPPVPQLAPIAEAQSSKSTETVVDDSILNTPPMRARGITADQTAAAAATNIGASNPAVKKPSKLDLLLEQQKKATEQANFKGNAAAGSSGTTGPTSPANFDKSKRGSVRLDPAVLAARKSSPKKPYVFFISDLNANTKTRETYEQLAKTYVIDFREADPKTGETPLMIAARLNNFELYKYILENLNENLLALNDQDKAGNTALHHILITLKSLKNNALAREAQALKAKHDGEEKLKKKDLDLFDKSDPKRDRVKLELDKLKADNTTALKKFFEKRSSPNLLEEIQQARTIAMDLIQKSEQIRGGEGLTLANKKKETPFLLLSEGNDDLTLLRLLINTNALRHNYTKASMAQVRAAGDSDPDSSDEQGDKEKNNAGSGAAAATPEKTIYEAVRVCDYGAYLTLMQKNDKERKEGKKGTINIDTPENKKNETLLILAVKGLENADDKKALEIDQIVEDLINRKADLEQKEAKTGRTALHIALKHPQGKDIALKLIAAMKNLEATDVDGNTPLHIVAMTDDDDHVELAQALIDRFVKRNSPNAAGKTPLQVAQETQQKDDKSYKSYLDAIALVGVEEANAPVKRKKPVMVEFLTAAEKELQDKV